MTNMRRIVTFDWVTGDGYFAADDGNLDWVVPDPEQVKAAVEAIPRFDTLLFGRKTFELFQGFWEHAVDEALTAPDPHHPGRRTREHGAIGMWMNEAIKLVFSRTLKDVTWKNARVLEHLDARHIDEIKRQPGKDMMVFGSASIVSQLTEAGLIDEYQLLVCPVLLGSGRRLFDSVSRRVKLELQEGRRYESGDMMLRYAPAEEGERMTTSKQRSAARRNIKKAASAAKRKRTVAHLPKKTRTALGKEGAKAARRKRHAGR